MSTPPEGLTIVPVETDDDLQELAQMKALDDAETTRRDVDETRALEVTRSLIRDGMDIWLARVEGKAVGYGIGERGSSTVYHGMAVYVRPEMRRRGIATELEKIQIARAKDTGFLTLESTVLSRNTASMALQRKLGFQSRPIDHWREAAYEVRLWLQDEEVAS